MARYQFGSSGDLKLLSFNVKPNSSEEAALYQRVVKENDGLLKYIITEEKYPDFIGLQECEKQDQEYYRLFLENGYSLIGNHSGDAVLLCRSHLKPFIESIDLPLAQQKEVGKRFNLVEFRFRIGGRNGAVRICNLHGYNNNRYKSDRRDFFIDLFDEILISNPCPTIFMGDMNTTFASFKQYRRFEECMYRHNNIEFSLSSEEREGQIDYSFLANVMRCPFELKAADRCILDRLLSHESHQPFLIDLSLSLVPSGYVRRGLSPTLSVTGLIAGNGVDLPQSTIINGTDATYRPPAPGNAVSRDEPPVTRGRRASGAGELVPDGTDHRMSRSEEEEEEEEPAVLNQAVSIAGKLCRLTDYYKFATVNVDRNERTMHVSKSPQQNLPAPELYKWLHQILKDKNGNWKGQNHKIIDIVIFEDDMEELWEYGAPPHGHSAVATCYQIPDRVTGKQLKIHSDVLLQDKCYEYAGGFCGDQPVLSIRKMAEAPAAVEDVQESELPDSEMGRLTLANDEAEMLGYVDLTGHSEDMDGDMAEAGGGPSTDVGNGSPNEEAEAEAATTSTPREMPWPSTRKREHEDNVDELADFLRSGENLVKKFKFVEERKEGLEKALQHTRTKLQETEEVLQSTKLALQQKERELQDTQRELELSKQELNDLRQGKEALQAQLEMEKEEHKATKISLVDMEDVLSAANALTQEFKKSLDEALQRATVAEAKTRRLENQNPPVTQQTQFFSSNQGDHSMCG